jgi:signal transduction histidine kinase
LQSRQQAPRIQAHLAISTFRAVVFGYEKESRRSFMALDVSDALAATARGRIRAPRTRRGRPAAHHHHAVQFYESDGFLTGAVADFLAEGIRAGEPVVVIATAAHREAFAGRLRAHGLMVDGACVFLDARDTLAEFMAGPLPDAERFHGVLSRVFTRVLAGRAQTSVRAFGEMVDVLWKDGNTEGAIYLEELWNEFAREHELSLLCAYSMGNFVGTAQSARFQAVCDQHSRVLPAETFTEAGGDARLREIAVLQQRARALEAEVEHRKELEQRLREALAARGEAESALRESEGRLRGALAERDELLRCERAARADAEAANRSKSEFLAIMSHELRTPLNAIAGYVDLLELEVHGPLSEQQRESVSRIERSGRHLLGLIDDVLNYARIESGKARYEITDVRVDEALRAAEALVLPRMQAKGIRYEYHGCDPGVRVRCDPGKLQQIVLNLLTNAGKFTDRGGVVGLECDTDGGEILVRVRDTGVGIPPEKLQAVFEPFVQVDSRLARSHEGVGLGLAISRDLARAMGGDLTVESTLGAGSAFTLKLKRGSPA